MKFSQLQRYIMKQAYLNRGGLVKARMLKFYDQQPQKPKHDDMVNIITRSVDRLIKKELLVGEGLKTAKKWFVREVKMTPQGRKWARKILGEQLKLPLGRKRVGTRPSRRDYG